MSVRSVQVGETIEVMHGSTAYPAVVEPACDFEHGHWYCVTCRTGIANNAGISNHDGHTLAWICQHGPEPFPVG